MEQTPLVSVSESLEASVSEGQSSRPKRAIKPKKYGDEFYVFDSPKNSANNKSSSSHQKEGKPSNFSTSTPVKNVAKVDKGRSKRSSLKFMDANNISSINSFDQPTQLAAHQSETWKVNGQTSDLIENCAEKSGQSLTKNFKKVNATDSRPSVFVDNLSLIDTQKVIINSSEADIVNSEGKYKEDDHIQPERQDSWEIQRPINTEDQPILSCKDDTAVRNTNRDVKSRNRDFVSKEEKNDDFCENVNKKKISKKKKFNGLEKKKSKRRKTDSSVEDSSCKENRADNTDINETSELSGQHVVRSLTPDVSESITFLDSNQEATNCKFVYLETSLGDEVDISNSFNVLSESHRKSKGRSAKTYGSCISQKIQAAKCLEACVTPTSKKRGRPRKKSTTQEISFENCSQTSAVSLSTNISVGSSGSNPGLQTSRSSPVENVSPIGMPDKLAKERTLQVSGRVGGLNETTETLVPLKRPRGRPPKYFPQNRTIDKPELLVDNSDSNNLEEKYAAKLVGTPETFISSQNRTIDKPDILFDDRASNNEEEKNAATSVATPETFVSQKRSRGRPRKNLSQNAIVSSESNKSTEADTIQVDSSNRTRIEFVSKKNRRGRPSLFYIPTQADHQIVSKYQDASEILDEKCEKAPFQGCQLCGKEIKLLNTLKLHMMLIHSLIWDKACPKGLDNPYYIIKRIGHIDCQICKKRFKNGQYYKHHQIWCGREDERATCEICNNTMRAMWLQQHMAAHKTQDKKDALASLKQEDSTKDASKDDQVDEGQGENNKMKRKAATKAIKKMSNFNDSKSDVDEDGSSDDYSNKSAEEDNDDVSDTDHSDDDISGSNKADKKKPTKVKLDKKEETNKEDCPVTESTSNNSWLSVCRQGLYMTSAERLDQVQRFYSLWSEGRVFPELSPRRCDWKPLHGSELKKYLPINQESHTFEIGFVKNKNEIVYQSLKFGNATSHNGTSYFYVGGSIWAIEWCPVPNTGNSQPNFLAVAADRSTIEPPDSATMVDGPGLIQIWSTGVLKNKTNCSSEPILEYAIAHDSGYVRSICWCPKVCFDLDDVDDGCMKRLGILAVGCSDGRVLIYCPPQPEELKPCSPSNQAPNVFRPQPSLVLVPNSNKDCGPCLSVSWQQGGDFKYIVAGYGQGTIFAWDISTTSPLLKVNASNIRSIRCFSYHKLAVLSISWNPQNSLVFVSASFDFNVCVWNVERPEHPIGIIGKYGTHQITRSISWAGPLHNGFFTTSDKTTSPDISRVCFHGLSKGALLNGSMSVFIQCHAACTFDSSFSPYYDMLVTCDATGKVKVTQLFMKDVRCLGAGKYSWHRSKYLNTILYQAKLHCTPMSPLTSQLVDCDDNITSFHSSTQRRKHINNISEPCRLNNFISESLNDTADSISKTDNVSLDNKDEESNESSAILFTDLNVNSKNNADQVAIATDSTNRTEYCIDGAGDHLTEDSSPSSKGWLNLSSNKKLTDCSIKTQESGDVAKNVYSNNIQESKTNILETTKEIICFHNCKVKQRNMQQISSSHLVELEEFHGSNSHAVHRVRSLLTSISMVGSKARALATVSCQASSVDSNKEGHAWGDA